ARPSHNVLSGTAIPALCVSAPLRSGPLRSGPLRSGPLRSGPLRSGPARSRLAAARRLDYVRAMESYKLSRGEDGDVVEVGLRGRALLSHAMYNKGTAFSIEER